MKNLLSEPTLRSVVNHYLKQGNYSKSWRDYATNQTSDFIRWLGHDPTLGDLELPTIEKWFAETRASSHVIVKFRDMLQSAWNVACKNELTDLPPINFQRTRNAFTTPQLLVLYRTAGEFADAMPGTIIPRSLWWQTFITVSYSAVLWPELVLSLKTNQVSDDGTIYVRRWPTNDISIRRVCSTALAGLKVIAAAGNQQPNQSFPLANSNVLYQGFRKLRRMAGIDQGTPRWVRGTAIAMLEKYRPGWNTLPMSAKAACIIEKPRGREELRHLQRATLLQPYSIDWEGRKW